MHPELFHVWTNGDWLESIYHCTNEKCHRSFIAYFEDSKTMYGNQQVFNFVTMFPVTPQIPDFSSDISIISPSFVTIYSQAKSAEDHQLQDIAGPGYRKALEFLVKDYAISLHPTDEAEIKRNQLVPVITKFLSGDSLPVVSTRAAWLGNDETHYERRWLGKDLTDLKKLIDATVHFITMQRLVADLPIDMPDPKKPSPDPVPPVRKLTTP
jgi:hypothetical protein